MCADTQNVVMTTWEIINFRLTQHRWRKNLGGQSIKKKKNLTELYWTNWHCYSWIIVCGGFWVQHTWLFEIFPQSYLYDVKRQGYKTTKSVNNFFIIELSWLLGYLLLIQFWYFHAAITIYIQHVHLTWTAMPMKMSKCKYSKTSKHLLG